MKRLLTLFCSLMILTASAQKSVYQQLVDLNNNKVSQTTFTGYTQAMTTTIASLTSLMGTKLSQSQADLLYKPLGYTPSWAEVTGKPSSFPPSTHSHAAVDIVTDATHRWVTDAQITNWSSLSAGPAGQNAYTTTTSSFFMVDAGDDVEILVASTVPFVVSQPVYMEGVGSFLVDNILSPTRMMLVSVEINPGVAVGAVASAGRKLVPGGKMGATGPPGPQGPGGPAGSGGTSTPVYSTTATTRADLQRAIDAVSSNAKITLMPGVYALNGTNLTLAGKNNVTIDGLRSATIVTGQTDRFLINGSTTGLTIEGVTFSSTATSGNVGATGNGLLDINEQGVHTDLTIRNCRFSAPTCLRNGISTNTYSATADGGSGQVGGITRLRVKDCKFISLGRMGMENLNHAWSDGRMDVLINDVEISGNEFVDCGRVSESNGTTYNGMAFSNSGRATNVRFVNNHVKDAKTYGIEIVGGDRVVVADNTVDYVSNSFVGLSLADGYGNGADATRNISITGNTIRTKSRPINMRGSSNVNLTGNTLICDVIDNSNSSSVYFQKCTGVTFTGGSVMVNSYNPIRLDDCSDMVIAPGRVTSMQTNNYASISIFAGTGYAGAGSANIRIGLSSGIYRKSNTAGGSGPGVQTTAANIYELQGTVTGVTTF